MTNQQTQSLPNTPNSQKQLCANNKRVDRRLNKKTGFFEIGEGQCNCVVRGGTPKFTLESYCEECRRPFEEKINKIIPIEGRNADLIQCDQVVKDYYDKIFVKSGKGLFLWGNPGVGKTWSQYAIIKKLILSSNQNHTDNISIYSMSKIYSDLIEGQHDKEFKASVYKDKICDVEILMIDDIGMEKNSEFRQEILEYIFDTRYKNQKFTLITSNYGVDGLVNRVGGKIDGRRIVSRISKMCEIIELKGNDKRLKS